MDGKRARREKDKDTVFWSYAPNEVPVEVGDIVGVTRKSGINYDNVYVGAPTHTDAVFDVQRTSDGFTAYLVGGNVGNKVSITKVYLDSNRMIKDPNKYLVVMKNTDLWRPRK